jgi:hypothetical protein
MANSKELAVVVGDYTYDFGFDTVNFVHLNLGQM